MHKRPRQRGVMTQLFHENKNIQNITGYVLGLSVHFVVDLQKYSGKFCVCHAHINSNGRLPAVDCSERTVQCTTATSSYK